MSLSVLEWCSDIPRATDPRLSAFLLSVTEQQPRVRGWLLASADGQTSGLVPANYVKVLGKRRGRRPAELEAAVQEQPSPRQQGPPPFHGLAPPTGPTPAPLSLAEQEAELDSVFREVPARDGLLFPGVESVLPPSSSSSSSTAGTSEKMDL